MYSSSSLVNNEYYSFDGSSLCYVQIIAAVKYQNPDLRTKHTLTVTPVTNLDCWPMLSVATQHCVVVGEPDV